MTMCHSPHHLPRNCACPCGCPEPFVRNVIYSGPCPPDPKCPCQPVLPPPPPDPPCYRPFEALFAYAFYAQMGALSVTRAGEPVPLSSVARESEGAFASDGSVIHILRPGTYQATFSMTLPAGSTADAQMEMLLDGESLPGSTVEIHKAPGAPGSVYVQTVFKVFCPNARFEVIPNAPIVLSAEQLNDTLASLTITQIGPVA